MTNLRFAFSALVPLLLGSIGSAQELRGRILPRSGTSQWLVLNRTEGNEHIPIDSTRLDRKGNFSFTRRSFPTGFYQLVLGQSDRVEIILGTREPVVEIYCDGTPLQEHLSVVSSTENQRLWEYKWASREMQARAKSIAERRTQTDPHDATALETLTNEESALSDIQRATLERMVAQDSSSYFAKVVLTDKRLLAAVEHGTLAIRNAIDWNDASLVRSAVYPKALMALLQSATPASPEVLYTASDSILTWASEDSTCWTFARSFLIDLFMTYGPEEVAQHLVDNYVIGPNAEYPPDSELLAQVAEQLKVATGSPAPDVLLPSPLAGDTTVLSELINGHPLSVLFFYSSTCDHCHTQMPALAALDSTYRDRGLLIIGIALDDDRSEFIKNIVAKGLRFPCYSELNAWGSKAAKVFAVRSTPSLIVLDDQARIAAKPYDAIELGVLVRKRWP